MAAVWHTLINSGDAAWLADRIVDFDLTLESVRAALNRSDDCISRRDRAFKTILKNRVHRGGILASGAGLMKAGVNGRGMASRRYPDTPKRRILAIDEIRAAISFRQEDALALIQANNFSPESVFFIDSPYTVAGRRLYTHSEIDHEKLFALAGNLTCDFLMTYKRSDHLAKILVPIDDEDFSTPPLSQSSGSIVVF